MPLQFSLAIHNALAEVKCQMQDGEFLFAFLDDVYIIANPARTRTIYNLVQDRLHTMAGIQLHQGKTRVSNREGMCPAELEDLGEEVWSPRDVKILGTPIGSQEFVQSLGVERLQEEQRLWEVVSWVPHRRSCCSVQGPAATTLCAPSHPASLSSTQKATIEA